MYTCVRATDGKTYLSDNGNPPPYQAPYGVLGAEQLPLSEVYGPDRGAAGISAPEANRGRVTAQAMPSISVARRKATDSSAAPSLGATTST